MTDAKIRDHLIAMIMKDNAHAGVEKVLGGFPPESRGIRPDGAAHSAWEVLEHMRITQWDILEFCRDPGHESPKWPDGYWPAAATPPDATAWQASVDAFLNDRQQMQELVGEPSADLFVKFPHGTGQTLFREACVVAKHNSYHTGELVLLGRLLGTWK